MWAHEAHEKNELNDQVYAKLVIILEYVRFGGIAWRVFKALLPLGGVMIVLIAKWEAVVQFMGALSK